MINGNQGIAVGIVSTISILLGIVFFLNYQSANSYRDPSLIVNGGIGSNTSTILNTNSPCSYMIFISGTNINVKNCSTDNLDYVGTDASTAIQFALTKISANGGEVFIKQGKYSINHPINFTGSSETIRGEGVSVNAGTWLDLGTNCNCNMFQYVRGSTIFFPVITELYMQGEIAHNSKGNGTFFGGNSSAGTAGQLVKDFELTQVYMDGFKQFGVVSNNAHDYKIYHDAIEHMGNTGLFIKAGDSIRIGDTLFRNSNTTIKAGGIQIGCNPIGGINPDLICGNGVAKGAVIANNKIEVGGIVEENSAMVVSNNIIDQLSSGWNSINLKFNDTGTIISDNVINGSGVGNHAILIDNSSSIQIGIYNNQFVKYVNSTISDSGTNTNIRNNIPTSINNELVSGTGISITNGLQSYTISNTGVISNSCSLGLTCSGTNPSTFTPSWQLLCQTVLGSANATIVCNFTATKNLIVQVFSVSNGGTGISPAIRFNGDSGTHYAYRTSADGGTDGVSVSLAQCGFDGTKVSTDTPYTTVYIDNNLSTSRKLAWFQQVTGADTSSATAPDRQQGVCKWDNITNQITGITILANAGTGNFGVGSELTVWGYN